MTTAATPPLQTPPLQTIVLATPAGELAVVVDPVDGAVIVSGFGPLADQWSRLPVVVRDRGSIAPGSSGALDPVIAAVAAYGDGDLLALDAVVVRQDGGPFRQAAWSALRGVAPGTTTTYTGLAVAAGSPAAVRAAGSACARNLVAPFVPCHRVVRSDGGLGGYYFGLPVKSALLRHEGALFN